MQTHFSNLKVTNFKPAKPNPLVHLANLYQQTANVCVVFANPAASATTKTPTTTGRKAANFKKSATQANLYHLIRQPCAECAKNVHKTRSSQQSSTKSWFAPRNNSVRKGMQSKSQIQK